MNHINKTTRTAHGTGRDERNIMKRSIQRTGIFLFALGLLSAPAQAGTIVTYVHTDHLGSPSAETDTLGREVLGSRRSFTPYGENEQGVNDGPGYTGHYSDTSSGLVYMQARYYDPEIGRFLSIDPDPFVNIRVSSVNRYWYVNGQVFTMIDPTGKVADDATELRTYYVQGARALPKDFLRFFWFVMYYAPGSAGDGLYDRKVRVVSGDGESHYYRGSTQFKRDYCGEGGESCPDRPDGTYAFLVKLGFNTGPNAKTKLMLEIGEMPALGPNTANKDGQGNPQNGYVGIWIHSGGQTDTRSKGCLTIDPNQWQDFIGNFKSGDAGSVYINF